MGRYLEEEMTLPEDVAYGSSYPTLCLQKLATGELALLEQTAGFVAGDVYAARLNGSILITALTRSVVGNMGSVSYVVRQDQTEAVEQVELLDRDGNVLTSCAVHLPLLEEVTSLRHSFTVKEGV